MTPDAIRHRLREVHAERLRLADEYAVLTDALHTQGARPMRRRPSEPARCGTDSGYYRHRYLGEPACDACKTGHADHERLAAARRRLARENVEKPCGQRDSGETRAYNKGGPEGAQTPESPALTAPLNATEQRG